MSKPSPRPPPPAAPRPASILASHVIAVLGSLTEGVTYNMVAPDGTTEYLGVYKGSSREGSGDGTTIARFFELGGVTRTVEMPYDGPRPTFVPATAPS
jgi:hypothetical protein